MKVWNRKEVEKNLKDVVVKSGITSLKAVDAKTGVAVCHLYGFGTGANLFSYNLLHDKGYRTDFAEWGEDGEMTKLLEDFE